MTMSDNFKSAFQTVGPQLDMRLGSGGMEYETYGGEKKDD